MQRIGKKGQAYFRLVVTEHTTRPKGKYLELLGSYDPHKNSLTAKADRVKHWMSQGAQLSPTANNLLLKNKLIEGEQVTVWKPKKNLKAKPTEEVKITEKAEVKASEPEALAEPDTSASEPETPTPTETSTEETSATERE